MNDTYSQSPCKDQSQNPPIVSRKEKPHGEPECEAQVQRVQSQALIHTLHTYQA